MICWKDDLQSTNALILLFTIELHYIKKKKKKRKKGVDSQKWTYNNIFRFYLSIQSESCWILQAINPLELAMDALKEIQSRFYRDFPPHPKEEVYGFATPSTMKPTQWSCKFLCLYWLCWGKRKSISFYYVQLLYCRSRRWNQSDSSWVYSFRRCQVYHLVKPFWIQAFDRNDVLLRVFSSFLSFVLQVDSLLQVSNLLLHYCKNLLLRSWFVLQFSSILLIEFVCLIYLFLFFTYQKFIYFFLS